jgi:hypothetical protein
MNWKNYWIASLVLIVGALMFNAACSDDCVCKDQKTRIVTPPPAKVQEWQSGQGEVVYDGYIRIADWNKRYITYESANGYIKSIGPVCGDTLPVWAGMHIYELNFHWYTSPDANPQYSRECFVIDYVLHAPTGDYKP